MKIYIHVVAEFTADGRVLPTEILWDDGRRFEIDKISEIRLAASLKAGGCGIRYKCRIGNHERYLFLDDENRWFVE